MSRRLKFASSAKPGEAHSSHESNLAREATQNSGQIHTSPDAATEEARNWRRVPRYKQFVLAVVFLATFLLSDGSSTASRAWEGAMMRLASCILCCRIPESVSLWKNKSLSSNPLLRQMLQVRRDRAGPDDIIAPGSHDGRQDLARKPSRQRDTIPLTARFKVSKNKLEKERLAQNVAPPEIPRGARVLIVDDNGTNRRILVEMFNLWHMKSHSAESGEEALAELSASRSVGEPYALILVDAQMPGMDGFALVQRIWQIPGLSVRVMMLTSAGHRGDTARRKELGIAAYLLKPIRRSELGEAIARVLGGTEQGISVPVIADVLPQGAVDAAETLRVLVAEDNVVNQRLIARLLEKRGHQVAIVGNGREALSALQQERYDLVLTDVQMPEMDGMEATRIIRDKEKLSGVHQAVIALTAHAMKGERCLAAGMDAYLTKPIRPQELDEVLVKYGTGRAQRVVPVRMDP